MLDALKQENRDLLQGNLVLMERVKDLEIRIGTAYLKPSSDELASENSKLFDTNKSLCSSIRDLQQQKEDLEWQNWHLLSCSSVPWCGACDAVN
eukprot:11081442-Karenia_brevis.AAC.1